MTSEGGCRLTYAEGRRISEEAARPYVLKGGALVIAGMIVGFASTLISHAAVGMPYKTDMVRSLGGRILNGDAEAIDLLLTYLDIWTIGVIICVGMVIGGLSIMGVGSIRAREALKEANKNKE